MKERRTALGRVTELAENVAAGVKRRQQARAPRAVLYDAAGRPRTLPVAGDAAVRLIEVAGMLVELTAPASDALDSEPEEE